MQLLKVACVVHLAVAVVVRTSRPLGQGFERSRQCDDSAARNELSGKYQGHEESGLRLSMGSVGRFLRVRGDGGCEVSKTAICAICVFGRTQTSSRLSTVSPGGGRTCRQECSCGHCVVECRRHDREQSL